MNWKWQAFVENVLAGKPSPVTAYDGMMGIKLALTATQSFREESSDPADLLSQSFLLQISKRTAGRH